MPHRPDALHRRALLAGMVALGLAAGAAAARADDPVKIGFITTLSGPGGYLGEDARDGFLLAVKEGGGKLGGVPVQVMVEDDGLKPAAGKQIATRFMKSDHVRLFTGTIFTNVALAMMGDILDSGAYWIGTNTSPNEYGGKDCAPNYFVSGWDETLHASAGVLANEMGKQRLFLMAPNYQAGKQILAAVKEAFKGQIVGEIYTSLDQTDFSGEIAQIRAAKPDAVYEFQPGGLGINFLKQWASSGLQDSIPLVVAAPSLDPRLLAAVGDAAVGMHIAANWNADLDNPANKAFVAAYVAAYARPPTYYAANAYDTARLIGSALQASGGKIDDGFGTALKRADFASVRGHFAFASNQGPVQDWYELAVVRGADGKLALKTLRKFRDMAGGAYRDQCKMK
jgi:branched-chain amino acid transport system substrate-binding protein